MGQRRSRLDAPGDGTARRQGAGGKAQRRWPLGRGGRGQTGGTSEGGGAAGSRLVPLRTTVGTVATMLGRQPYSRGQGRVPLLAVSVSYIEGIDSTSSELFDGGVMECERREWGSTHEEGGLVKH